MADALSLFRPPADAGTVRLIPLGGVGEFGMNLMAYLTAGRLFVVDCGVRFPDPAKLGVDAVLPDVGPFFAAAGGVHAYLLTHGHEDHLGALAHVLPRWPAPVYATPWTMELLKLKLAKLGLNAKDFKLCVVEAGDRVATEGFEAEYVHVNHSIPGTCALMIRTAGLKIFHTGDFKFEDAPLLEPPADMARLAVLGREGVDLLLADSTNAEKSGFCPPESAVLQPLIDVIKAAPGAVILTTFSSNLWRLKSVADACVATGRKLHVAGTGLETTLTVAKALGIYHLPETLRVADEQVDTFPRERLLVLATGCQGEWRSAMARIANGEHRTIHLKPGDTVVMSSRVIPGNEKSILAMTNGCLRAGARIITSREAPGIHVSGHAYGGDLERLAGLLKPRHYLPVHGAFSQLRANQMLGSKQGELSTLFETGDVLDATKQGVTLVGKVEVSLAYVDGDSGVVLPYETLRQRLRVGETGAALLTGVLSKSRGEWLVPPAIELTGLSLPASASSDWLGKMEQAMAAEGRQLLGVKGLSLAEATEELRVNLRRRLNGLLKKKPVVVVKVYVV